MTHRILILMFACIGMSLSVAAQGRGGPHQDGPMVSAAELTFWLDTHDFRVDDELAEDEFFEQQQRRRDPRNIDRGRDPRHQPPRGVHRHPQPLREVMCVARNGRGMPFRAFAFRPFRAEIKAMRMCERNSFVPRTCHIIGCRVVGSRF